MTPQPFHYKCEDCGWTGNDAKTIRLEDHCPNCNSLELTTIPAPSQLPSVEKVEGFTPGPWKLLGGIIGNDLFCRIHAKDVTSDTPRDLQVFALNDSHPDKNHLKRRFADMKLIAQAPTMYAEIQALQKEVEGMRRELGVQGERLLELHQAISDEQALTGQLQQENERLKEHLRAAAYTIWKGCESTIPFAEWENGFLSQNGLLPLTNKTDNK